MNKTVPPDQILDVRVRVPLGMMVTQVIANTAGSSPAFQDCLCPIEAVTPAPKPTFEVGKSYRTRKGDVVRVVRQTNHSMYPLQGENHNQCWTLAGRYWTDKECSADLMPGAVEDEPEAVVEDEPEHNDPIAVIMRNLSMTNRRIKELEAIVEFQQMTLQAVTEGMEAARNVLTNHGTRLMNLQDRINEIENHKAWDELSAMLERIEALEKVSTLRTNLHIEVTKRIAEHENRLDRHETNLASHAQRINDTNKRLDRFEQAAEVTAAVNRLAAIEPRPTCGNPECGRCYATPPKPTIKGGWVNVYWSDYAKIAMVGELYPTKAEAGADGSTGRIACIQIPDIQEGEGL